MPHLIGLKDFSTRSSRAYRDAMRHIQAHLEDVLGDDTLLAYICAGGKVTYINVFARNFRAYKGVDRHMAEMLWLLFVQSWVQRHGHLKPGAYLDKLEWKLPPSPQEIDAAWVHESASSDDARRYFGAS